MQPSQETPSRASEPERSALAAALAGIPEHAGGVKGILMWAAALAVLGYMIPELLGSAFFDLRLLLAYAAFSVVFLAPVVCEAVGADKGRRREPAVLRAKIVAGVLFGVVSSLLLIAIRVMAVNRSIDAPGVILPPASILGSLFAISLALAWFGASASAAVTVKVGHVPTARQVIRTGFLLLLLALIGTARYGPGAWSDWVSSQLTLDALPRLALIVSAAAVLVGRILYRKAARDPRYSEASNG